MHKHLDAYVTTTALSCNTLQSLPQQSKTKTSRKIYNTVVRNTISLVHRRFDTETVVIQKLTDDALPPTHSGMNDKQALFLSRQNQIHSNRTLLLHTVRKTCFF